MAGVMEGHQDSGMVSRNQDTNSETLGRGKRPQQPSRLQTSGDFIMDNNGSNNVENRVNGAPAPKQRGTAQTRGATRGGRGRKTNTNMDSDRITRQNSDLVNGNNTNRRNSVSSENSDTEDEDRQIGEISESVSEAKEHVSKNEIYTKTCLLAILRTLSASSVDFFKQDASANKDNVNYKYVHSILAELNRSNPSYADVVGTEANPTEVVRSDNANVGTETYARSDNANVGTVTRDVVREIMRQEAPRMIEDTRRKKNIIILGMDEGYDERGQVEDMLSAIGCGGKISAISARPIRLGVSRRGRNRPIKVEFNDERAVDFIIERKWNVRHTENFCYLFINRDLCKSDREKEKLARRQNRANRNLSEGETNQNGGRGGEERRGRPDPRNFNRSDNGVANRNENAVAQEPRETNEPNERENQNQATEDQAGNQNTQSIQQNLPMPGDVQGSEVRAEEEEGGSMGNNVERGNGENSTGATYQGL